MVSKLLTHRASVDFQPRSRYYNKYYDNTGRHCGSYDFMIRQRNYDTRGRMGTEAIEGIERFSCVPFVTISDPTEVYNLDKFMGTLEGLDVSIRFNMILRYNLLNNHELLYGRSSDRARFYDGYMSLGHTNKVNVVDAIEKYFKPVSVLLAKVIPPIAEALFRIYPYGQRNLPALRDAYNEQYNYMSGIQGIDPPSRAALDMACNDWYLEYAVYRLMMSYYQALQILFVITPFCNHNITGLKPVSVSTTVTRDTYFNTYFDPVHKDYTPLGLQLTDLFNNFNRDVGYNPTMPYNLPQLLYNTSNTFSMAFNIPLFYMDFCVWERMLKLMLVSPAYMVNSEKVQASGNSGSEQRTAWTRYISLLIDAVHALAVNARNITDLLFKGSEVEALLQGFGSDTLYGPGSNEAFIKGLDNLGNKFVAPSKYTFEALREQVELILNQNRTLYREAYVPESLFVSEDFTSDSPLWAIYPSFLNLRWSYTSSVHPFPTFDTYSPSVMHLLFSNPQYLTSDFLHSWDMLHVAKLCKYIRLLDGIGGLLPVYLLKAWDNRAFVDDEACGATRNSDYFGNRSYGGAYTGRNGLVQFIHAWDGLNAMAYQGYNKPSRSIRRKK